MLFCNRTGDNAKVKLLDYEKDEERRQKNSGIKNHTLSHQTRFIPLLFCCQHSPLSFDFLFRLFLLQNNFLVSTDEVEKEFLNQYLFTFKF